MISRPDHYHPEKITTRVSHKINGHSMPLATMSNIKVDFGKPLSAIKDEELIEFETGHPYQLVELVRSLRKAKVEKIALEGGHIYAHEIPTTFHDEQLKITGLMRKFLIEQGFDIDDILLVDNFHTHQDGVELNLEDYLDRAYQNGWPVDHVIMEKDMSNLASVIASTIDKAGKATKYKNGLVVKTTHGAEKGARLYEPESGILSCALLDAALSIVKLINHRAQAILNVLPRGLKQQQYNTRQILRNYLDEQRLPFFNFFIDEKANQNVSGSPHWFR